MDKENNERYINCYTNNSLHSIKCTSLSTFILLNIYISLNIAATLNCLQNDGDGIKRSKACDSKDEFCYFKIKGGETSSIERGCTDKEDFKGLRNLFYSDIGCFICTKPGGCKDNERNEYEEMDEIEMKCFCNTENCNGICNASEGQSCISSGKTDVERCSVEKLCRPDLQPSTYGTTTDDSTTKPVLKCLDNDGDETQRPKECNPSEQYCSFKNEGTGSSNIERDCANRDNFDKLRRLFNEDTGCFICRKPGGCKHVGMNAYEDMDENEIQCFCKTNNCNEKCKIRKCENTIRKAGTDVEFCAEGCANNTSKPYLKCFDNDGDETQKSKPCTPDDQYCYFKNEGKGSSNIERDCADRGDLDKLRRLFNEDAGCFICRKLGGCKHVGINLYEDMDENEIQCFCEEKNCNGQCEIANCETTSREAGTDVEFCSEGCDDTKRGGNASTITTNVFETIEDGTKTEETTVGGGNIHRVTQLCLLSLMFVTAPIHFILFYIM